jgi:hypothetical protein
MCVPRLISPTTSRAGGTPNATAICPKVAAWRRLQIQSAHSNCSSAWCRARPPPAWFARPRSLPATTASHIPHSSAAVARSQGSVPEFRLYTWSCAFTWSCMAFLSGGKLDSGILVSRIAITHHLMIEPSLCTLCSLPVGSRTVLVLQPKFVSAVRLDPGSCSSTTPMTPRGRAADWASAAVLKSCVKPAASYSRAHCRLRHPIAEDVLSDGNT